MMMTMMMMFLGALGSSAYFSPDFGCSELDLVVQDAAGVGQGELFQLALGTLQRTMLRNTTTSHTAPCPTRTAVSR